MAKGKTPRWLDPPVFFGVRAALSLPLVAGIGPSLHTARSIGRAFGGAKINTKRRERATQSLSEAFPDWDRDKCEHYAMLSYEHLFQLAVEMAFTTRVMTDEAWLTHIDLDNVRHGFRPMVDQERCVLVTGHCGNWELLGFALALIGFPVHAIYRPLDNVALDRWAKDSRQRRGMTLIDKFGAAEILPDLVRARIPVGFIADQNAGDRGAFVPYFGRLTSSYKSIALLVMHTRATVVTGAARRLGWNGDSWAPVGRDGFGAPDESDEFRYRLEVVDTFGPDEWEAQPDPMFYITARYRHSIEKMVRTAPEQYLWMHRMWKSRPRHERLDRPFPGALREKLAALPWMSDEDVERIVDRSEQDRRFLRESGRDRLP